MVSKEGDSKKKSTENATLAIRAYNIASKTPLKPNKNPQKYHKRSTIIENIRAPCSVRWNRLLEVGVEIKILKLQKKIGNYLNFRSL